MPTKKKRKSATPRVRRSPFERSLEHAQKRLEKAMDERQYYERRLESLNREIPYLQTVVKALTPKPELQFEVPAQQEEIKLQHKSIHSDIQVVVPQHLERFMGKTEQSVPVNDNDFLPEDGPGEWHDGKP